MKISNHRTFISLRVFLKIAILCFIIFLMSLFNQIQDINQALILADKSGYQLSNLDILNSFKGGMGLISTFNMKIIIIPMFSILTMYIINTENDLVNVIRYKNRRNVWNKNVFIVLLSAFIMSTLLVVGGYLISGFFIKCYRNTWIIKSQSPYMLYDDTISWDILVNRLITYKVLIVLQVTTFFGLSCVGIFIRMLKLFIHDMYIFITILIMLVCETFGIVNFNFVSRIVVNSSNWLNITKIIVNNIYFILGFFLLYIWGRYIYIEKDQFIKINGVSGDIN